MPVMFSTKPLIFREKISYWVAEFPRAVSYEGKKVSAINNSPLQKNVEQQFAQIFLQKNYHKFLFTLFNLAFHKQPMLIIY